MKIRVNGIEFDVDISAITYRDIPVMEIIKDACDLAHEALEDMSVYRQEHDIDGPDNWELGYIEGRFCQFLDKLGD